MRILQIATGALTLVCLLHVPTDAAASHPGSLNASTPNEARPGPNTQNSPHRSGRRVTVTGKLTGEGAECQAFRSNNGVLYTLTGNLRGFKEGDKVRIVGRPAKISTCMQGTTLVVESIKKSGR